MNAYYQFTFCHTPDTIRRLAEVQRLSFEKSRIWVQILFALFAFYAGTSLVQNQMLTVLFYIVGAWLLVSWKQIPRVRADQILRQCGGVLPETEFSFDKDCLRVENDEMHTELGYDKILRLSCDKEYDYIFVSRAGAYMLPRQEKEGKEKAFREFLSKKRGWNGCRSGARSPSPSALCAMSGKIPADKERIIRPPVRAYRRPCALYRQRKKNGFYMGFCAEMC